MAAETETFVGASGELHDGTGFNIAWEKPGTDPAAIKLDAWDDGTVEGLGASIDDGAGDTYYLTPTAHGTDAMAYGRIRNLSNAKNTPVCAKLQDQDNYASFDVAGTGSIGTRIEVVEAGVVDDGDVRFQGSADLWVKIEVDGSGNIEGFTGGTSGTPTWSSEGSHATTAFGAETRQGLVGASNTSTTFGSSEGKYYEITFDSLGGGGTTASGGSESTVQAATVGDGQKSASAGSADTVAVAAQAGGQKAVSSGSTASVSVGPQGDGEKAASAGSVDSVSVAADGGGSKQSDDGATATIFVAGSGAGAKLSTDGASSTVSVSPQGDGEKSGQGSATSSVQVSADGGGQVAQENAGGSLASVSVSADGGGIKVAQSGSEATSEVTAVGAGTKEAQDGSTSTVTVSATGGGSGAGPDPKAQVFIAADDRETINAMRENDTVPAAKDPDVFSRGDCVPQEKAA